MNYTGSTSVSLTVSAPGQATPGNLPSTDEILADGRQGGDQQREMTFDFGRRL